MSQIETAAAEANVAEYCALTETRNGEIYALAPSFFSEGPLATSRHDLKNFKTSDAKPRRYHFVFTKPRRERLWLSCTYRKGADHLEKLVEVRDLVTTCDEITKATRPEVVESFKCNYRTFDL